MAKCTCSRAICLTVAAVSLFAVACCQGDHHSGASGNNEEGSENQADASPSPHTEDSFSDWRDTPTPASADNDQTEDGLSKETEASPSPDPDNDQTDSEEAATSSSISDANHSYSISCDPETSGCDSLPLHEIARMAGSDQNRSKSLTINFNTSKLQLHTTARFTNISQVAIIGGDTTLSCTADDVGIEILNITLIRLENIRIEACGSIMHRGKLTFRAAVHIVLSHHVTLQHATITHSNGIGLNLQRNTGNVLVRHSYFTDSTLVAAERNLIGGAGNGVVVFVTVNADAGSTYCFVNCTFARNSATGIRYDFILSTPHNSSSSSQGRGGRGGRGGGLRVTIKSRARQVQVQVINSSFENNFAFLGAGMSAEIEGGGTENAVIIRDTTFTRNGCKGTAMHSSNNKGLGGGAYLSFEGLNQGINVTTNYIINFTRVTFDSNCAELGGGAYFFSDPSRSTKTVNKIEFNACTWRRNYAHTGSAIDITSNIFKRAEIGYLTAPAFRNCQFIENTIRHSAEEFNGHKERQSYGSGTLYSSLTSIKFQSNVRFQNNFGSGIVIVNGAADFVHSNATFTGNMGIQGGAILLIGTASMIVGGGRSYNFRDNKASDRGGAIHSYLVDDMDFIVSRSCFIQYQDPDSAKQDNIIRSSNWTASLVFEGNVARRMGMGNSIFATSVVPCKVTRNPNQDKNDSFNTEYRILGVDEIFQPPGIVIKPSGRGTGHSIATEANRFQRRSADGTLRAIPGKLTDLRVSILDDFNQEVQATLTAFMQDNTSVKIDSEFSCITDHTIKLNGDVGARGTLVLQTIGTRKISLALSVELQPCPPGFNLNAQKECKCNSEAYVGIETCRNHSAVLTQGFWAGYINNVELGTSICPVGFCRYNDTNTEMDVVILPENSTELEEAVCGETRQGILCGKCQDGYTTFFHSPSFKCKVAGPISCRLGWLFYVLSELVPVTLLFLFVLVLNISLTTGAVNGFILFSQLLYTFQISASGVIQFPRFITALIRVYQIIYGFITLDLFTTEPLSFCLWENATVLDMLAFKYVTVAYSLLLVVSVILFMKYRAAKCFGRYYSITALRNSVIHGLSGFLVLTYAQCINVSFRILYSQDISLGKGAYETHRKPPLNRVFFNGDVSYMSREHLAYAIPAILILLVIGVFPPLVLLGHPLLNRAFIALRMEKAWLARCLIRTSKLKPLLDSFQGSFKDNFRFFAGIYFFYRWLAALTYAIVSQLSLFYTVIQALLIIILVVHSVCQPYQKRWHNVLDTLLLANLVVINGLTTLHYYSIRVDGQIHDSTLRNVSMGIQITLIYLPLVYIMAYTIACILGKTCCKAVKDEPSKEDFVLKKIGKRIYHSSFSGSGNDSTLDDSMPYRLMNKEERNPFEESCQESKEKSVLTDTYLT